MLCREAAHEAQFCILYNLRGWRCAAGRRWEGTTCSSTRRLPSHGHRQARLVAVPVGHAQPAAALGVLAARLLSTLARAVPVRHVSAMWHVSTISSSQAAGGLGGLGVGRVELGQADQPGAQLGVGRPVAADA